MLVIPFATVSIPIGDAVVDDPTAMRRAGDVARSNAAAPVLKVKGLKTHFRLDAGTLTAVDGVSFEVHARKVLCVVGESGSGKSVMARSVLRLVDSPGRIVGGSVHFHGQDLMTLSEKEMEHIRGDRISLIFQNPMTSLNPALTVGEQVAEGIVTHKGSSWAAARKRALELFDLVGIPDGTRRYSDLPHQFSGGMRQRILIAAAIACEPDVIIADEPTTALDVTIQAQILKLLKSIQERLGSSLIMITHDLGVVAAIADEVAIMYAGRIVEQSPVHTIFANPRHPYTRGLIGAMRSLEAGEGRFAAISGAPLVPINRPKGCSFAPRCTDRIARCGEIDPQPEAMNPGHLVACIRVREVATLKGEAL
jgi:oligopeptide/dipeptide ABC transporter ATP-binding protein